VQRGGEKEKKENQSREKGKCFGLGQRRLAVEQSGERNRGGGRGEGLLSKKKEKKIARVNLRFGNGASSLACHNVAASRGKESTNKACGEKKA